MAQSVDGFMKSTPEFIETPTIKRNRIRLVFTPASLPFPSIGFNVLAFVKIGVFSI